MPSSLLDSVSSEMCKDQGTCGHFSVFLEKQTLPSHSRDEVTNKDAYKLVICEPARRDRCGICQRDVGEVGKAKANRANV